MTPSTVTASAPRGGLFRALRPTPGRWPLTAMAALALAACRPESPPPAPPPAPASLPMPAEPVSPPPPASLPLPDQPSVRAYTAQGEAPAWQASVNGQTLTLTLGDGAPREVTVTPLAYARGIEFGADGEGGRVVLSITSERPCRAPDGQTAAYAATLIVGREVRKGCAEPA